MWLAIPLAGNGDPIHWALFALAAVPAWLALRGWTRGVRWAPTALISLLLVEIVAGSLWSSRYDGFMRFVGLESDPPSPIAVPRPLRAPDVDLDAFLEPGPFVDIIGEDRYLTWAPPAAFYQRGYLAEQEPSDWPALTLERGTLFGVRDVLGYNPAQLQRYWAWIRAVNQLPLFYNATSIQLPTARDADLTALRYLIVPEGVPSPLDGAVVATDRGYDLVELDPASPLVSVVPRWTVVDDADAALGAIADPSFRVGAVAILENDPGLAPAPDPLPTEPAAATVSERSSTDIRISVDAAVPSIVVVRNSFDDGWRATIDGEPATVLPVDGFLQGVPIGSGAHEIRLTYHDDAVAAGLWLSAAVWLMLASAWAISRGRERGRTRERSTDRSAARNAVEPAEPAEV